MPAPVLARRLYEPRSKLLAEYAVNGFFGRITTSRATVSPMYADASGDLVQYAANNVALVGGDSVACWPGLRNLLTRSEDFSHSDWLKGGSTTVTANAATSPDGTDTADRIELPAGSGTYTRQAVSMSSGQAYTFSVYVKSNTGGNQNFVLDVQNVSFANGDPTAHVATTSWQRFDTVYTPGTTGTWYPIIDDNAGAGADLLIWGAQLTQSSYLLPYVPTAGSSVAVDASEPRLVHPSDLVNDLVISLDYAPRSDNVTNGDDSSLISGRVDGNDLYRLEIINASQEIAFRKVVGGSTVVALSSGFSYSGGTYFSVKTLLSSKRGIRMFINDTLVAQSSNATALADLAAMSIAYLGSNAEFAGTEAEGTYKNVRFIKVNPAITDAEVKAL